MENAAKGLLMAGGMLLAVIVISLFIYGYTNVTHLAEADQNKELLEEIQEYNQQYLAYNKSAMYGTDVISILNLAISNNKLNNVQNTPNDQLFIDIAFKLNEPIEDTAYKYTYNTRTNLYEVIKMVGDSRIATYGVSNFEFTNLNTYYSLSNNLEPITAFVKSSDERTEQKNITKTDRDTNTVLEYTITYKGIADFKRKTFKCSKVEYDQFGRVKKLQFEQIRASSYGG